MTAIVALVLMAAVTLVDRVLDHRHRMKVADRERLVDPVKAPSQPKRATETVTPPALVPGMKEAA